MQRLSRSFTRHASLKSRGIGGAALPRRRCQATAAGSAFASTSARTLETPNHQAHAYSVPAPIHSDFRQTSLSQHRFFPASSTVEQLALLEICLATGNLVRARKVFNSIRTLYLEESRHLDERSSTATYEDLDPSSGQWRRRLRFQDVVPVAIHTQFLRAFFRQAVVQQNTNYVTRAAWLSKKALVSEAWEWFEMLLNDEQNYGQLDDGAWAVMLKGLVATNLTKPSTKAPDISALHLKPISHLYHLMKIHGRSLESVLQNSIFSHAGIAGLNDHPAVEVCEELASVLATGGETDALLEVNAVQQRLYEEQRSDELSRVALEQEQDNDLKSTQESARRITDDDFTDANAAAVPALQPARQSEEQAVPFKLNSLLGNLEAITGQKKVTKDPYIRQDLLEESAYDAALWQSMHEADQLDKIGLATEVRMKSSIVQEYMSQWLEALTAHLETVLSDHPKEIHKRSEEDTENVKELLRLVRPAKLASVTVIEVIRSISNYTTGISDGVRAARAIIHVGRTVEDEYGADAWKALYPDLYDKAMKSSTDARKPVAIRSFMQEQGIAAGAAKVARQHGYGDEADDLLLIQDKAEKEAKLEARKRALPWTQKMRAKVGGYLLKALIDTAFVKRTHTSASGGEVTVEKQPAFWQSYQYVRSQKVGVIKMNPVVADRLDKDYLGAAAFPRYLPMLVKPKPWTSWNNGGYRIHATPIMRTKDSPEQEQYVRLASENGTMDQVFTALTALGNTAWRINRPVFDVIAKVWNMGDRFGVIPPDNATTRIPAPAPLPTDLALDPSQKQAYQVEMNNVKLARTKAHSQRCNLNYKLEIARAYLDETFYFPHNIDFRGRAYPIPPNLSHIGDDVTRGLLEFAEGRPVGRRGIEWLHIQIANSAGFDKASLSDRQQYTKDLLDEVMDSADRPLDGNRWWLKADDPWQCLAACMELTNALRAPDSEKYISHLPVQQDGTCNGLQHYAALGGDKTGAQQVNLSAGDKPADVYTAVAKLVNVELDKDIANGEALKAQMDGQQKGSHPSTSWDNENVLRLAKVASVLKGKVNRKVVKQTVMTTVYGVTFIGAKRQIQRQLRDRGDIPAEWQYGTASYLAEKVLTSIGDLFKGASSIQLWLSVCARLIGKSVQPQEGISLTEQFKHPMASVIWTTPLGLPVAQPYRQKSKSQVNTALQSVYISDPNKPTPVDPRAQATGFPPNYVHSLDATHMMMTAIECERRGLVFASVHDSYWTHACDVDEMSVALRDCFIKLHSRNLLEELKTGFQERYAGYIVRKSNSVTKIVQKKHQATTDFVTTSSTSIATGSSIEEIPVLKGETDADVKDFAVDHSDGTTIDLQSIIQEYGTSALPPLAIAQDATMLKEIKTRERLNCHTHKIDEEIEAEEEALFVTEEEQLNETTRLGKPGPKPKRGNNILRFEDTLPVRVSQQGRRTKAETNVHQNFIAMKQAEAAEMEERGEIYPLTTARARQSAQELQEMLFQAGLKIKYQPSRKFVKQERLANVTTAELSKMFPQIPPRGDFDLEIIRDSPYFFS